jgi:acyl-CoA thioesterase-1
VVDQDHIYLANIQAPGNLGLNYTSKFNRVFSDIAIKERVNLMQFVIPEVFTNSSYMQNDGIHPNASGYKVIIDKHIVPSILQQIK